MTGPAADTILTGIVQADLPAASIQGSSTEKTPIHAAISPVIQAEVWLEDLPFFPHQFTDANGQYIFTGLPAGSHRVIASFTRGALQYKQRSAQIIVNSSVQNTASLIQLLAATQRVTGILRQADGTPYPAGTRIVIWGEVVTLGNGGTFVSPLLPSGIIEAFLSLLSANVDPTQTTTVPASTTVTVAVNSANVPFQIDITVLLPGTDNSGANLPPVITFNATSSGNIATTTMTTAETLIVEAIAVDPEGKALTAVWSAEKGTLADYTPASIRALSGTENRFYKRFTPTETGTGKVTVVITDADGKSATGTVSVTIGQPADAVAPTAAITYSVAGPYKVGTSVTITATFNEAMKDDPAPKIAMSGGNTLAATAMTKTSATVYSYTHVVGAGEGNATVALSNGTDLAGNAITAAPTSGANFVVDNTAPTIANNGLSPADDATNVSRTGNLVITFSENVVKGTGNLVIKKIADNSPFETIAVTDAKITVNNTQITIDPAGTLAAGTQYYVEIAATCFTDAVGNAFAGIAGNSTWNFTSVPAPTSITINPAPGFVAIGRTSPMTAIGTYADNSTRDVTTEVTWSSSDTGKATIVPTTGVISGVAVGQTTVTATHPDGPAKTATVNVDVNGYAVRNTTYAWEEISVTGTNPAWEILGDEDDNHTTINIPFTFTYFGNDYTTIYPNSNGAAFFGAGSDQTGGNDIPTAGIPDNFLGPWYSDLVFPGGEAKIFYEVKGTAPNRRLIIQWDKFRHFGDAGNTNTFTFEAILYETSNNIVFQYKDTLSGNTDHEKGKSAIVGLENIDGTKGIKFSFAEANLYDGLAVSFQYQEQP